MGEASLGRTDRTTEFHVRTRHDTLQSKKESLGDEMACASNYYASGSMSLTDPSGQPPTSRLWTGIVMLVVTNNKGDH